MIGREEDDPEAAGIEESRYMWAEEEAAAARGKPPKGVTCLTWWGTTNGALTVAPVWFRCWARESGS